MIMQIGRLEDRDLRVCADLGIEPTRNRECGYDGSRGKEAEFIGVHLSLGCFAVRCGATVQTISGVISFEMLTHSRIRNEFGM